MSRESWVYRNGQLVPKAVAAQAAYQSIAHLQSALPSPNIRSDYIKQPFRSPINGLIYESKSAWEGHVKASGYAIVGNDRMTPPPPPQDNIEQDVAHAFDMVEQGYRPPPLELTNDFGSNEQIASAASTNGAVVQHLRAPDLVQKINVDIPAAGKPRRPRGTK